MASEIGSERCETNELQYSGHTLNNRFSLSVALLWTGIFIKISFCSVVGVAVLLPAVVTS